MSTFKVGDFVKGTNDSPYYVTDKNMTKGEVLEVSYDGERILVKVLEHETQKFLSTGWDEHWVDREYFVKIKDEDKASEIKIEEADGGTYITIENKYTIFTKAKPSQIGVVQLADIKPDIETAKALATFKTLQKKED